MKNYKELLDYIKAIEHDIAYGSETIWWGRFLDDISNRYPDIDYHNPEETDMVSDDVADWWYDLYDTLEEIETSDITDEEWDRLNDCTAGDDWISLAKEILRAQEE